MMDRRAFITGTLSLLAAPLVGEAQPAGKVYRIGLLYASTGFDPSRDPTERALVEGLREHGYVLGQNLVIELRSAYGKRERLPELAVELVRIPVVLILVPGPGQARTARQATATIPIVFGALPVALWAVSQPTAGLRPGVGILGRPVGVTPAYWEPVHARAGDSGRPSEPRVPVAWPGGPWGSGSSW
jgi:putative tryptophan/tyrosine transport system substrate-binding protein